MQPEVVARKSFVHRDISPTLSSFRHPMHSPERGHGMQMITAAAFIRATINPWRRGGGREEKRRESSGMVVVAVVFLLRGEEF